MDGESYDIVSDMYGDIALEGTDDNDASYSLFGKNISISKKDSQDTPADITVAARPEAPSAPKTLADIQNPSLLIENPIYYIVFAAFAQVVITNEEKFVYASRFAKFLKFSIPLDRT